jgi:hypothetical protein
VFDIFRTVTEITVRGFKFFDEEEICVEGAVAGAKLIDDGTGASFKLI